MGAGMSDKPSKPEEFVRCRDIGPDWYSLECFDGTYWNVVDEGNWRQTRLIEGQRQIIEDAIRAAVEADRKKLTH